MKYCEQTTKAHEINQNTNNACLSCINEVIAKDYNNESRISNCIFEKNEIVIDLDKAEELRAKKERRAQNQSMDMCFGLSCNNVLNFLLVEFKLGFKNKKKDLEEIKGLNPQMFIGKVEGSQNLLGNSIYIKDEYVFVFQSEVINRVKNRIKSLGAYNPDLRRKYIVMNIHELKERYFEYDSLLS